MVEDEVVGVVEVGELGDQEVWKPLWWIAVDGTERSREPELLARRIPSALGKV